MFENSYEIEHMIRFRNSDIQREIALNRQICHVKKRKRGHMRVLQTLITFACRKRGAV
jgi:hypothetical protein